MVRTSFVWLFLLAAPLLAASELPTEDFGARLNERFLSSARFAAQGYELVVIAESAESSTPISEVVSEDDSLNAEEVAFEAERQARIERLRAGEVTADELSSQMVSMMFPINSAFKPTKLPYREVEIPAAVKQRFLMPLAVVGADKFSLSWLALNLEELKRINASVVVTSVESEYEFLRIRDIAAGLVVLPVNADALLKVTGVNAYPIVLTQHNAFQ
ncbi:PFL_4695 family integrating conjugative element protein [Vibrio sp. PNB22_3_1]